MRMEGQANGPGRPARRPTIEHSSSPLLIGRSIASRNHDVGIASRGRQDCLDNSCLNIYYDSMSAASTKTSAGPREAARHGALRAHARRSRPRHFDSLEQQVFLNLWRTYDRLRIEEDRLFESYGLTPQQYNALRLLRGTHPGSLATLDLAERLVSRAPDITRLLDKLEVRKLIERERPAANRRVVEVRITAAGQELLRKLDEPVRRCHARQLGHMPQARLREFSVMLQEARRPHESPGSVWADR